MTATASTPPPQIIAEVTAAAFTLNFLAIACSHSPQMPVKEGGGPVVGDCSRTKNDAPAARSIVFLVAQQSRLRPRLRQSLDVEQVLEVHVLAGDVAAARAAAQGERGSQGVVEGTDGAMHRRLVPHHAVGIDGDRELLGDLLVLGEDAGRVTRTAELKLRGSSLDGLVGVRSNIPA